MPITSTQPNRISQLLYQTSNNELSFNKLDLLSMYKRQSNIPLNGNINAFTQLVDLSSDWVAPHKMLDDNGIDKGYYYQWVFNFKDVDQSIVNSVYSNVIHYTNDTPDCFDPSVIVWTGLPHAIWNVPPVVTQTWNITTEQDQSTDQEINIYTYLLNWTISVPVYRPMDWLQIKAVVKLKPTNLFL